MVKKKFDLASHFSSVARVGCLWFLAFGFANESSAATFLVSDPGDSVDLDPGDGVCSSARNANCTLRAAIMEANALAGADTIRLNVETIHLALSGIDEDQGATGDLDILESLTIESATATPTTVNANGIDRVFDVIADVGEINFSGLTIRGGDTEQTGGGIRVLGGKEVRVADCVIEDNRAGAGGGIFATGGGGIDILRSTLRGNRLESSTANLRGSAIEIRGDVTNIPTLTLDSVAIHDNESTGRVAGAINASASTVSIINSTLSGNFYSGEEGDRSSALSAFSAIAVSISVRNTTIVNHNVGLSVRGEASLSLRNSIVAYNNEDCTFNNSTDDIDGHNLDSDNSCQLMPGFGNLPATDPLLGPLVDGRISRAHWPLPGSPLIDAGSPDTATGVDACTATDQQGVTRTDGDDLVGPSVCDIGAVEFQVDVLFTDGFEAANS